MATPINRQLNVLEKTALAFVFLFLSVLTFVGCNCAAYAGTPPVVTANDKSAPASLAPMLKKVQQAVVNVAVRGELPPMRIPIVNREMQRQEIGVVPKFEELGSGVIADAEHGYILTNAHVVKDAKVIIVTLNDGRKLPARVVGYDVPSDIGVLQIPPRRLAQIIFGDSDKLNVGDFVSAIGSPFGLQQTVTSGIVSGLERSNLGIEGYENFIQTDAPINPGNSGGALVNMQGELIGINTAIVTSTPTGGSVGVGLAIPSNMAKSVMQQIIKYGKVERGILGVLVQDVTPALSSAMHLPSAYGALVSQVIPNTPAAKAGIKRKDVIVELMNKPIRSAAHVRNIVSLERVGTKISMKVWRDQKLLNLEAITINPDKMQAAKEASAKQLLAGLELREFNQLVDNEQVRGVQAIYVDDNSIAYSCGLRAGDVILTAQDQPVTTISDLQKLANKNPTQLLLEVKRGSPGNIFLVLEE